MQNTKPLEKYDAIQYLWKTYVCSPFFLFYMYEQAKNGWHATIFFSSNKIEIGRPKINWKTNEKYAYVDSFHLNTMRSNTRKYSPDAVLCYFNDSSFALSVYARVSEQMSEQAFITFRWKRTFQLYLTKDAKKINNMPHTILPTTSISEENQINKSIKILINTRW